MQKEITLTELYVAILSMTEALNANTAAILGKPAPTEKQAEKSKPKGKAKPETDEQDEADDNAPTQQDVEAALIEVKNKFDDKTAKAILKEIAGTSVISKIDPEHYEEILLACEVKLQGADAEKADDENEADDEFANATRADIVALSKQIGELDEDRVADVRKIIKKVSGADKTADADPKFYPEIARKVTALLNEIKAEQGDDNDDV